ncbi:hypothetical protein [Calothrix sp. NIES-3974]|uniref:hypothetical protein n=1 Tax=Calothrix sp. NIES-3974 TaxID=2005462 RepID=UPI000B609EF5|nr:hypothetical protein [Calothrix sp. NIES-3974]BAZ04134.1 hypothetical protein NIES3974_07660 [Calothrix sp. NIES-3974]
MLLKQKILIIAACCIGLIGCTTPTPTNPSTQVTEETRTQQQQQQQKEELRLIRERERENQRQIVISNIKQLEQQANLLSQRMVGRQQNISNLELQRNQLAADIRNYKSRVEAFMLRHKNAIACMGAVGVSLDENNQYSQDVKDFASVVGVICGVAVIGNEEFRNEVLSVVDQLTQADNHTKNLQNNLRTVQSQLDAENQLIVQEKSQANQLAADIQKLQSQLGNPSRLDSQAEI